MIPQAVDRVYRRVMMAIGRGRITTLNDNGAVQTVQAVLGGAEVRDNLPRVGEYGLASVPPVGTDVIVVFVGGDRSNGVVIGTNNQSLRVKQLADGDTAIYDSRGHYVLLTKDGITVEAKSQPITINNCTTLTLNGNLQVNGTVTATGEGTFNGGHTVSAHRHGGVTAGGAQTATPTG